MRRGRSGGRAVAAAARAGLCVAALLGTGVAASFALGARSTADRDFQNVPPPPTLSLPTFTPPVLLTANSTVTASATSVVVGTPFTLSVLAQYNAGNLALGAQSEQVNGFGPNLTLQSGVSDQGSCTDTGSVVQCPFSSVAAGNVIGATLVVLPTAAGTYQFTAQSYPRGAVSSGVTVNVLATTADLSVEVPTLTLRPTLGHHVRVGIVVANAGPLATSETKATLTLPPELGLVSAAPAGDCRGKPLVCQLGSVAVGGRELLVLTLTALKPGAGRLLVSVSGQPTDPTLANNSGSIAVAVARPAPVAKTPVRHTTTTTTTSHPLG